MPKNNDLIATARELHRSNKLVRQNTQLKILPPSRMGNGIRSARNTRRVRMVLRNIYLPETVEETLAQRASTQRKSTNQVIREILEKAAQTRASTSRTNRSSRVLE